jgi:hypothetical protein
MLAVVPDRRWRDRIIARAGADLPDRGAAFDKPDQMH